MADCVYQLRVYEVDPAKREAFLDRFHNHALRIMDRYDFEPVAIWESKSLVDFEFLYILKWPDLDTMERQWKKFLADEEWTGIKTGMNTKSGDPVLKVTGRILEDVPFSPPCPL